MYECGGELAEAQKVVSKANVVGACDTLMNLLHKRNTNPPLTSFPWLLSELNEGQRGEGLNSKGPESHNSTEGL